MEREEQRRSLMAAAQRGDAEAYRTLLRECLPLIRATVRRQRVHPDFAEDIVQDVLLTLHRVRHTYDPARPFEPWLGAISKRRCIDLMRSRFRHNTREIHAPIPYEAHPDDSAGADETVASAEQAADLHAAIARLPAAQQEAVRHLALGEQSLRETAARTSRSEVALKVNLHRAIKALRGLLANHDHD
jgi:RNA polymerase sigma-70 factor (ECF subfamily)